MKSAFLFSGKMQEVEMFIQTKCNELSFADLIRATKDTIDESKKFPYKTFVARCGNCLFCYKGKCSLKECCCMGDRVKAGSCSFTELLNHCFRNIGDNHLLALCFKPAVCRSRCVGNLSGLDVYRRAYFQYACACRINQTVRSGSEKYDGTVKVIERISCV